MTTATATTPDERLLTSIAAANAAKGERLAELKQSCDRARHQLAIEEQRMQEWEAMSPFQVAQWLAEKQQLRATLDETDAARGRRELSHARAVAAAKREGRGILTREAAGEKRTFYPYVGGLIGLLSSGSPLLFFDVHVWMMVVPLIFCVLGFFGGAWLYSSQFVEDESLG